MSISGPSDEDDPDSLNAAIEAGLSAVAEAARAMGSSGDPIACRDVGRVFDTAIEHGAPIWNRGSHLGCARIYLRSAVEILARVESAENTPLASNLVKGAIDTLRRAVAQWPSADPDNADRLGWAMRGIFDRFHAARGIEDVDQLIETTRASGGRADLDLVGLCLTVAIAHGNILYQGGALDACAVLHHHVARRLLRLASEEESGEGPPSPGLARVRRELTPIVSAHPVITQANAEAAAWMLYEAFQKILQLAPEDSRRTASGKWHSFISYRRKGGVEAALALRAYLQMRGLNSFMDMDGLDSGAFGPRLLRAIEEAPTFLLVLTPDSLERCSQPGDWMRLELAHAIETNRTIIPVLMNGVRLPEASSLPEDIRALPEFQAVTFSPEYFGAVIDRIEQYIRSALDDFDDG